MQKIFEPILSKMFKLWLYLHTPLPHANVFNKWSLHAFLWIVFDSWQVNLIFICCLKHIVADKSMHVENIPLQTVGGCMSGLLVFDKAVI